MVSVSREGLETEVVVPRGGVGGVVLSACVTEKVELSWFLKVFIGKGMEEMFQMDSGQHE